LSSRCWSAMAMATCVLTCKSWLFMSRMTCLIIFSGSSALSIKSLRLARTKVETRSSNAIRGSFASVVGRSSLVVWFLAPGAAYQGNRDISCDSGCDPDAHMSGGGADGRAHGGSEGDGQGE